MCKTGNGCQLTLANRTCPSKAFHQGRDEVLHSLGAGDKHEKEALGPHSPVNACHLEGCPVRDVFNAPTLRKTNAVRCQSVAGQDALLLVEKAFAV